MRPGKGLGCTPLPDVCMGGRCCCCVLGFVPPAPLQLCIVAAALPRAQIMAGRIGVKTQCIVAAASSHAEFRRARAPWGSTKVCAVVGTPPSPHASERATWALCLPWPGQGPTHPVAGGAEGDSPTPLAWPHWRGTRLSPASPHMRLAAPDHGASAH